MKATEGQMNLRQFEGPRALDLLAEFRRKYLILAERRSAELRAVIDTHRVEGPSAELRDAYDEYEYLRHFEDDFHRMIQAFVIEALKPWQEAFTDAAMRTAGPLTVPSMTPRAEHVAWLCFGHRSDNHQPYLFLCDSDTPGAFKVYR